MDDGSYTIRDIGQLKMMAHPYRLKIMHDLANGKFTVTQLAEKYGDTPAKVHHHVKKLEKAGLVKLVETHEVSGILEKYYQAVAGDFHVERSLLKTAEAQDSATDSIQRMLRFVYTRAKRGLERAVAAAGPAAGDADAADAREPSGKAAGTLGITHVRLRPSEARELSSKLWAMVGQYEEQRGAGAGQKEMENEEKEERIGPGSNLQHGPGYPCGPMAEGGGGLGPVEDEPGSYAVAIIVFPDEPSDEAPADSST
ncbi:MAG: ArsR/SmtB family transcription factor [Bacteroidota bacterium]